jgi:rubrerythrin
MTRIAGASVWEQELYDHVTAHGKNEGEVLQGYAELAETTDSPAFGYLARLILDDERRHHQLLDELAETIRTTAELSGEPTPIPDLPLVTADRERILTMTERFLALENEDNKALDRLAKELKDVRNTTLWELVVRLMQDDNAKHRRILEFIRDRARETSH